MKRMVLLTVCLLLCLTNAAAYAQEELLIVHATDMHYLSPSLTDYGDAFMELVEAADGKVTHYTPQLMQAFVQDMLELAPDAIVLSGDLTLNGATQSHTELVELLMPLKEAGIQVLALAGNHDTGGVAYVFGPEGAEAVEGTEDEAFDDLYAQLGYNGAMARDSASMSYVAQISPEVWCILVDVNANGTAGTVNEETFAWLEAQLAAAQEAGVLVIAVSHQPVLTHNRLFTFGYVINNNTRLLELYEKYAVPLNLSGHLHMQHVARSGELTEIAGSSLAVSPHQVGLLTIRDGKLAEYRMQSVDVAGWAQRTGETNADLLAFAEYSQAFFDQTTTGELAETLAQTSATTEEQQRMLDFAARLNAEYFSGARSLTAEDEGWQLWQKYLPDAFFTYYMQIILDEAAVPVNAIQF